MSGFSTSGGVHSGAGAVDDSSLLSLVPPSAPSSAGGAAAPSSAGGAAAPSSAGC